ncbi:MAG TPA: ArsI/CadI family heavy metal resistance metalloenzyme [Acidimicrobiia bacterium]|nr:ArsI/CadI family heavy metal resistance metalloenzyme [Acidimicrobiia bacterium]
MTPSRVQLALNVSDLDEAVDFYTRLFATEPRKREPGYANFAIADPPLKLVLFQSKHGGTINHLGVEVANTDDVDATQRRLNGEGVATDEERATTCCYAVQDKVWATAPDDLKWEVYTVLEDVKDAGETCADDSCGDPAAASDCCA